MWIVLPKNSKFLRFIKALACFSEVRESVIVLDWILPEGERRVLGLSWRDGKRGFRNFKRSWNLKSGFRPTRNT